MRQPRECGAVLPVTHHDEVGGLAVRPELGHRPEERWVVFDRDQAAHAPQKRRPGREAEGGAQRGRRCAAAQLEPAEVQAERDHLHLVRPTDAHGEKLGAQARAHRDQPVRPAGQPPLDREEGSRRRRREVALQHVAVERVHRHGDPGHPRGQPAQSPRLGGVGVDDVRSQMSEQADQLVEHHQVAARADGAAQLRDHHGLHPPGSGRLREIPLAFSDHSRDERRDKSRPIESRREQGDVLRRPPDVQPRDDARHADGTVGERHGTAFHASCSLKPAAVHLTGY
ncbi:MAG: hypothetical protein NTW68_00835 [candidate division NC10 bacterium]|nr:hypothetical protein [candidate division NC10 bacterium]